MYAFVGMYESLLDTATNTILHLRNASLSIASSEKGEEHKRVKDAWNIPSLVERGYWHDLIKDMSNTKTAGTLESAQQFLERLQELLHQLLDQMKSNDIPMSTSFEDEFITQLGDVMADFHRVAQTTDALLESFNRPKTPEPVEEKHVIRAFSVSPPSVASSPEKEIKVHAEINTEPTKKDDEPKRRPTRRRHRLRPHRRLQSSPSQEHDPKTASPTGNTTQTPTLHSSE